ncbi:hypothetical protein MKX01_023341 [Papaver californicum]|nr:hypothetical protein MKX01_023341 [Papaver californicum]
MANMEILEPIQYGSSSSLEDNLNDLSTEFDPFQFPPIDTAYLNDDDLTVPEGLLNELGFDEDGTFDFTFDDINFPSENGEDGELGFFGGDGSDVLSSTVTGSGNGPNSDGGVMNSMSPESRSCDRDYNGRVVSSQDSGGCGSGVSGFLNSPSPADSGGNSASSSVLPVVSNPAVVVDVDQKIKLEVEGKEGLSKRKKITEDENPTPRNNKVRKSNIASESMKSQYTDVVDDDDKKKARLMRNRESAQLSRQRKKNYIEELEDKVRSMHSTIAYLNGRVSYFMAENATLRQQLSGGVCAPPPGMYPPPHMAHMPYPWMPCPPYPMRTQGSQVPLVPIPRLKQQQPASTTKAKKSENKKKNESKTKKVASVSFLGLLFFMFLFGVLVPSVRENKEIGNSGLGFKNGGSANWPRGRVLTVNGNGSEHDVVVGLCGGKSGFREGDSRTMNCKGVKQNGRGKESESGEPLVASLYVPRNDKLVKIDGNLIIHSVLASERAKASKGKTDKSSSYSASKGEETGLAIPGDFVPALVSGENVERHRTVYRSAAERQRALSSGSTDSYKDSSRTTAADRSLQKWFREGLAGPVLSSGMCTEVFQFDVSKPGGIIPAASIVNITSVENGTDTSHLSGTRNRRILNRLPVPVVNGTQQEGGPAQDDKFQVNNRSMIVSVLVDPREGGDGSEGVDGMMRPKSLSRIFVVVLLDSVKYVTYSCVLPLKGSGPHLVTS